MPFGAGFLHVSLHGITHFDPENPYKTAGFVDDIVDLYTNWQKIHLANIRD